MNWTEIGIHAKNLLVAALAAALVQCVIGFLTYLGAHIPDLLQYILSTGSGLGAIYKINNIC